MKILTDEEIERQNSSQNLSSKTTNGRRLRRRGTLKSQRKDGEKNFWNKLVNLLKDIMPSILY